MDVTKPRSLLARLTILTGLVATMLIAAFALWPQIRTWQQGRLAQGLVVKLERAERPNCRPVLIQVARFGDPGITALVRAAASEKADVALAAREIIKEQLATWKLRHETDGAYDIATPTNLLAAALAENVDKFGPFGQQWATRLAVELADLAADIHPAEAVPLLTNCSTILDAIPPVGPRLRTVPGEQPVVVTATTPPAPEIRLPALPSERAIASTRQESAPQPLVVDAEQIVNSKTAEEITGSTQLPAATDWLPEWQTKTPVAAAPNPEPLADAQTPVPTPIMAAAETIDVPSPEEMEARIVQLKSQDTRTLLMDLNVADKFQAGLIRTVLKERGLTSDELVLGSKFTASDPQVRLNLVDDLQVLPARTARWWLKELLSDSDANVRLKALTALATTNDPELIGIAREVAVEDTDPRVSELATRIMRGTIKR
jgi:hypothetical protein